MLRDDNFFLDFLIREYLVISRLCASAPKRFCTSVWLRFAFFQFATHEDTKESQFA